MSQLDVLAEAISGWRNPEPRAAQNRERSRERGQAIRKGLPYPPWTRDELIAEVELLRGTDKASNICRRIGYANPGSLLRRLRRAGRDDLANSLENGLRAERRTQ